MYYKTIFSKGIVQKLFEGKTTNILKEADEEMNFKETIRKEIV